MAGTQAPTSIQRELRQMRARAVSWSLFHPSTLEAAMDRLTFVQADPIRSPARAQDLILRHRVEGYRMDDLEHRYPSLGIEEDVFYAYGFLTRPVQQLLHPRTDTALTERESDVLAAVHRYGTVHPRTLEAHFGRERVVNAWGGYSKATTRALERLHHRGLLRVARRENGIRVYEAAPAREVHPPDERMRGLVLAVAGILAPVPETTLRAISARLRRSIPCGREHRTILRELLQSGELESKRVDGLNYLWPATLDPDEEHPRSVRFLAPFDPLVWDRQRFEHLWHWPYRFEAYTPPARRLRGYYAMPLLWGEAVIGWANVRVAHHNLHVELGFVGRAPADRAFRREVEAEVARMAAFLNLDRSAVPVLTGI